jgi:hypothetical protein
MSQRICGGSWCLLVVSVLIGSVESQEEKKPKTKANPAYTREKDAGPDFAIQGEYVGNVEFPNGEKPKVGAQVVAQGDGKFRIKFHLGGLPGAGWDGKTTRLADAITKDGKTVFVGKITDPAGKAPAKDIKGSISEGVLTAEEDDRTSTFKRIIRTSPTLGAKPPQGAIVLFDGTSADEWKGGKVVEDMLLNNGIYSKRQFKDFKAHLEFRLPFMPYGRGQGRANSGFYPQGHNYEVQILDSFGLDGKNNECGGLYTVLAPSVNMCFPPLSWQTYDIEFRAARFDAAGKKNAAATITVVHNGETVHDHVAIPVCTEDHQRKIEDKAGPIHLQNHGDPVYFKNIWVVDMK